MGGGVVGGEVVLGDNLPIMRGMAAASVDLIYLDPPFNTGRTRRQTRTRTSADPNGDRRGFGGRRYATVKIGSIAFGDRFDDYLGFLEPRLREARRLLAAHGTLYLHLDPREAHYAKVLLDAIFGRDCFLNEVIWAYDFGGRAKDRWPAKHDTILVYAREAGRHLFNADAIDRIPYMAPGLVGPEKAARGKLPTDCWWQTVVPTGGTERTGYPTQKPVKILERIVAASSPPGGLVLDGFAGSGTTGEACLRLGRRFVLIDEQPEAVRVMARRFVGVAGLVWRGFDPGAGLSGVEVGVEVRTESGVMTSPPPSFHTYGIQPASDVLASGSIVPAPPSARPPDADGLAWEERVSTSETKTDFDSVETRAEIPASHKDLLETKALAHVATIGPDGEPQNNPVWFGWDGQHLLFSQTTGRQKYRNLQREKRIALSIVDPANPYRYLEVRGAVARIDPDPSLQFINSMAKKYMAVDTYPNHQPGDERVVIVVEPRHTTEMG